MGNRYNKIVNQFLGKHSEPILENPLVKGGHIYDA